MNSNPRPSPGSDQDGPPPRRPGPSLRWANLLVIVAVAGVVLLSGVPLTRKITAWVEQRADLLRNQPGAGDAHTYFFADHEHERRLYSALYFPAHHGEDLEAELLELRIVGLGPEVVPVILAVLAGELKLLPGHPPPGLELGPLGEERFLPNRDVLLEGALWRFEPHQVYSALERWMGEQATTGQRLITARVLTELRDPRSPGLLLRVLSETRGSTLGRPHVRAHFERALAGVLERHAEGIAEVREQLAELDPASLELVVNAMPLGSSGAGLDLILELLEQEPDLAPAVLRRISVLADSLHGDMLDDTLWQLQWLVDNPEWEVRRGSAVALGKLQDPNSCQQLIRMLADPERRVSKAALWALREMSSRNFPADQQLWQSWYEGESTWFAGPCVGLEADLQSEVRATVVRAVGLLCYRPLFRNHTAVTLSPLLWSEDPDLVMIACAALEQLNSRRAVPFLVERLADVEDEATAAVRATLQSLTGLDLPPEQDAWLAALGL